MDEIKNKCELDSPVTCFANISNCDLSYIDLSHSPISTFKGIDKFVNLNTLIIKNTLISSFKYATQLSSLKVLDIRNTPLSRKKFFREMALLAFGFSLELLNKMNVTEEERKLKDIKNIEEIQKKICSGFFLSANPLSDDVIFEDDIDEIFLNLSRNKKNYMDELKKICEDGKPKIEYERNLIRLSGYNKCLKLKREKLENNLKDLTNQYLDLNNVLESILKSNEQLNIEINNTIDYNNKSQDIFNNFSFLNRNLLNTNKILKCQINFMNEKVQNRINEFNNFHKEMTMLLFNKMNIFESITVDDILEKIDKIINENKEMKNEYETINREILKYRNLNVK